MQLLDALRQRGPATASQLAQRLGESSGATSYHLRQLAAHGFVEDAPEQGKGWERWWQAVDEGLVFDSTEFEDATPVKTRPGSALATTGPRHGPRAPT